jgi:hypothetical protein
MFNRIKKFVMNKKETINQDRVHDSISADSGSDSDSMEVIDGENEPKLNVVDVEELERELEYQIVSDGKESIEDLKNVACVCTECGEDMTEYIMGGETEVIRVMRISRSASQSTESDIESSPESIMKSDRSNTVLSPEGLCLKCEISEYPSRFHGCAFCRRPLRDLFACSTCRIGFTNWIKDAIPPESFVLSSVRKQAKKIVSGVIGSGFITNREFLHREEQLMFDWPGFYAGTLNITNNGTASAYLPTWIIPHGLRIPSDMGVLSVSTDLTSLTQFKMFEEKLLTILRENNIDLYANVQIDMKKFDSSNIAEVNPYDTSILR